MLFASKRSTFSCPLDLNLETSQLGEMEKESIEIPPAKVQVLEGHTKEVAVIILAYS